MKNHLLLFLFSAFALNCIAQPAADFSWTSNCRQGTFTDLSTCNGCTITGWSWDFGDGSPLNNQQNPTHWFSQPGTYNVTLTVTDNNSTIDNITIAITTDNGNISIGFSTVSSPTCGECNGTISAAASGGSAPYNYLWAPIGQNSGILQNACSGTYSLTVTDQFGCVTSESITLSNTPSPTLTLSGTNPSACGASDGSISATASGGTLPYSYQFNFGPGGPDFLNIPAGPYTVTVTDINGCSAQESITLTDPFSGTIVLDSLIHINCFENNSSGTIVVHAEGGSGGYTYIWSNGSTDSSLHDLQEGSYSLTVSDNFGCSSTVTYTITNTSNLYLSTTSTTSNCENNGTATVTAQGQHPPYAYVWSDGQTTATAGNLSGGLYQVEVTDSIGCTVSGLAYVDSICMNVIRGKVYLDTNENCIQDIGEPALPNAIVYSQPGNYYASTDGNGDYILNTPELNNTISVPSFNLIYQPTCPPTGSIQNVNFSQMGDTLSQNNFGYYADLSAIDLKVNAYSGWARPGFDYTCQLSYRNNGLLPQDAVLRFYYDPLLVFISAENGGVHDGLQNSIEWTLPNLLPGTSYSFINILFTVPVGTPIGTQLNGSAEILPVINDINPADNIKPMGRVVTASFDPNDKSVDPIGEGLDGLILPTDTAFYYTIRFQNTGNDTAFTVVLKDTLSAYLNPATLVPGASSHPYTFNLTGQGEMTFRFNQILLPDSNINEPASHGYITYAVNAKSDLPLGTVIENTAHIFFDFNEAIVTNTTKNTIAMPVGLNETIADGISVFPNPAGNSLVIESTVSNGFYELYDLSGKILLQGGVNALKFNLDIDALSSGVYFITVSDFEKQLKGKVVKE